MKRLSGAAALASLVEVAQETLDPDAAVPAHDARRNLVAEREGQDRRMVAELGDLRATISRRIVARQRRSSRNATCCDHGSPTITRRPCARGFVEQVAPRRRVGADRVDAEGRHQPEVLGDLLRAGELVPVGVGRERPVGHALDEEALVAGAQEFPVRGDPRGRIGRRARANGGADLNGCAHNNRPCRSQSP